MFPTSNSTVYRNEDGEVLGWDTHHDNDAPDPDEFYDQHVDPPEFDSVDACKFAGWHGSDGDGTDVEDVWECGYCPGKWMYEPNPAGGWTIHHVTDDQYEVLKAIQPEAREDEYAEVDSRCPTCGEPIDYCQGHGEIGDPEGYANQVRHDAGDHSGCFEGDVCD